MTRNIHVDASVGKPWEILNHCAAYSRAVFKLTKRLHRVEDSYGVGRLCHNVTLTHLEPISLRSESSGHPRTDSHCHSGRASIGRNIVAGVMAIIVMSGNGVGTMWLYSTSFCRRRQPTSKEELPRQIFLYVSYLNPIYHPGF